MNLKQIISSILLLLLIVAFMIPTSTYASTQTSLPNSQNSLIQLVSNLFSSNNQNNQAENCPQHNDTSCNNGYCDSKNDDWWNWLHNDKGEADTSHCSCGSCSWGNDNGCTESDKIWKKWYCL